MTIENLQALQHSREALLTNLAAMGDLRPGSLLERRRRCGKATCHCATPGDPGHPDWILTRSVRGKTVTRAIPAAAVANTRLQLAEYRRFRELVHQLIEANIVVCDAKLAATKTTPATAAEKKGSRKPSPRKSPSKSKP